MSLHPLHAEFTGPFACLQSLLAAPDDARPTVRAADFLDGPALDEALEQYSWGHGGRLTPALVSSWSQSYLAVVSLPVAALSLRLGRPLPVAPADVRIAMNETGLPAAIHLDAVDAGRALPPCPAVALMQPMLDDHLAPMIERFSRRSGLSPRLFWGNAAHYIEWLVKSLVPEAGLSDEASAGARACIAEEALADGRRNPLCGAIRYAEGEGENGAACRRRRTCCLRYGVEGVKDCGSLCPLTPQAREKGLAACTRPCPN